MQKTNRKCGSQNKPEQNNFNCHVTSNQSGFLYIWQTQKIAASDLFTSFLQVIFSAQQTNENRNFSIKFRGECYFYSGEIGGTEAVIVISRLSRTRHTHYKF